MQDGTPPGPTRGAYAALHQIAFIEANVPDAHDLANGVQAGVGAMLLDPSQDGVRQIADDLASHHIQSRGAITNYTRRYHWRRERVMCFIQRVARTKISEANDKPIGIAPDTNGAVTN